jgi:phage repressor protein C with HTH and peptisase S24 domain
METKNSNIFDRILEVAESEGYKSINDFAINGLKYRSSEKLNRLKDSAKQPSVSLLQDISNRFEKYSLDWLITGSGKRLKKTEEISGNYVLAPTGRLPRKSTQEGRLVPFYDVDFAAGDIEFYSDNTSILPAYTMDVPEFSGCTAFRTYGDSMEPAIRSGSILFGTRLEDWQSHLEYGQIYGIVCRDDRKYLKYIRKDKENPKTHFLLVSENDSYDDFELPKEKIKSLWLIHGWINKRV